MILLIGPGDIQAGRPDHCFTRALALGIARESPATIITQESLGITREPLGITRESLENH